MNDSNLNSQSKKERRIHPRRALFTHVNYKVMMPSGDKGKTQNVSEGGICLMLNRKFPLGTILELNFESLEKESRPIETFAKVIWQKKTDKGFLTGLKFGTK